MLFLFCYIFSFFNLQKCHFFCFGKIADCLLSVTVLSAKEMCLAVLSFFPQSLRGNNLLKLRYICDAKSDRILKIWGSFHWHFSLGAIGGTSKINPCRSYFLCVYFNRRQRGKEPLCSTLKLMVIFVLRFRRS